MASKIGLLAPLLCLLAALVYHRRVSFVGVSGFGYRSTAEEVAAGTDLSGKIALVTGATSGLGWETARVLSKHGAHVFAGGRSLSSAKKSVEGMRNMSDTVSRDALQLTPVACSLGSLADVSECAKELELAKVKQLDLLVLNAGIAWLAEPTLTPDGFETTMGVNHLAHFQLTRLLLPLLLSASAPRVVILSSSAAYGFGSHGAMTDPRLGMDDWVSGKRSWKAGASAYGDSKLANLLHARELHNRYGPKGLTAFSVNPGEILTGIVKPSTGWLPYILATLGKLFESIFCKTIQQGAATQVYCALHAPSVDSGHFFEESNVASISSLQSMADDASITSQFWDISAKLIDDALR